MIDVLGITSGVSLLILLAMLGMKAFALVDALRRQPPSFVAADKQTKKFWVIVLGLALAWNIVFASPLGFVNIIGVIAAGVYLADARPALREVERGGRSGRQGPYGPW